MKKYPKEIQEIDERFFRQAYETLYDNLKEISGGMTMSAFNHSIDNSGFSPTLTTRPDGFKTAICVIQESNNGYT